MEASDLLLFARESPVGEGIPETSPNLGRRDGSAERWKPQAIDLSLCVPFVHVDEIPETMSASNGDTEALREVTSHSYHQ